MASKYQLLCTAVHMGSFKAAAEATGYTQSAVSQSIRALERELETTLLERKRGGVTLTRDGAQYYPYLQAIATAESDLEDKHRELTGLASTDIRIATFTNVSRTVLPPLIRSFGAEHPRVRFTLKQGDYTRNIQWVREGSVDFCFTIAGLADDLDSRLLYHDEMVALLPRSHRLCQRAELTLEDLADERFILLDEGDRSLTLEAFEAAGIEPLIDSVVTDDYTIIAMVSEGLGVSALYRRTVEGFDDGIVLKPIRNAPSRDVVMAWRNWNTMPIAARGFASWIERHRSLHTGNAATMLPEIPPARADSTQRR